jgi:hypothetical protein
VESGTFPSNITEFNFLAEVRLPGMGSSGQNSVVESGAFLTYIAEFYVLVGVRLMEVGFSGQNSVVESAHNRALYCHFSCLYNGILRSCWSKTDGGGIFRADFSANTGHHIVIFSAYITEVYVLVGLRLIKVGFSR